MLNKIKLKLTVMNTLVVLAILVSIVVFVYVMVKVESTNNTDQELITNAYQLKRYVSVFDKTSSAEVNAELSDEYVLFKERLLSSSVSYGIWDAYGNEYEYVSAYNIPYDSLFLIRSSMFTASPRSVKVSNETDGKYFIHTYSYNDVNLRICSTVVANDAGQMRIVQTVQNMNLQENMADKLLKVLILAMLIGATLSFVSGYFIAGRSIVPIQESMTRQKNFVADASHELRTPVTVMRTNLDVVKSAPEESVASQMEWIQSAYTETEYMQKLIDKLLTIAKADLGDMEQNHTLVDMRKMCKSMRSRFKPLAEKQGVKITFSDNAKNEKMTVRGDEANLKLLFSNIIDNALHYSGDGKLIKISLVSEGSNVRIDIADKGMGIAKEDLENIFERFYRTDKARSRREGGSGLGLPIARQIAEEHHGKITADSEKGKGTVITVILPKAKEE